MPTDTAPAADTPPASPPPFRLHPAITILTHNVKGPWRKVVLPPKVVLVGLNGSGKTAVVQALELALTGKCQRRGDGLLSKGVDLVSKLHPAGRGVLGVDANVTFMPAGGDDAPPPPPAVTPRFSVTGTPSAASTPVHTGGLPGADYDQLFPAARAAEILDGGAETARKAILAVVSDRVSKDTITNAMREVGVTRAVFEAAGIDPRLLVPQRGESRLSALNRAFASIEAETRRLAAEAGAGVSATESAAPAAEGAVGDYEARVESARAAVDAANAQLNDANAARDIAIEARREHLASRPPEPAIPEHVALGVQAAVKMRSIVADHEYEAAQIGPSAPAAPRCPVCTWPLSTERLDKAREEARRIAGKVRDAKVAHAAEHAEARQAFDLAVVEAERRVTNAREAADTARQHLDAALAALTASRTTAQTIVEGAAESAADARGRADACTRLRDRLHEVRGKVLESSIEGLSAALSAASGMPVGIVLAHGKREVAEVGVWAGVAAGATRAPKLSRMLRTELSGAEWARLVSAFVAVSPLNPAIPYRCIVIPDRQLDPKSLVDVCTAMGAEVDAGRVSQVILQRTSVPEMLPAGWAVVNVHQNVMHIVPPDWAVPQKKGKKGDHGDAGDEEGDASGE